MTFRKWSNGNNGNKFLSFVISISLHLIFAALLALGEIHKSPVSLVIPIELVGPSENDGVRGKEKYSSPAMHEQPHRPKEVAVPTLNKPHEKHSRSEHAPEPHSHSQESSDSSAGDAATQKADETAAGGGQASGTELQAYISQIVRKIDEVKIYPEDSVFREEQGRVMVLIEVHPDGQIGGIQLVESCSFDSLNRAAVETIKKLGKLPSLPQRFKQSLKLQVPINYQLSRR